MTVGQSLSKAFPKLIKSVDPRLGNLYTGAATTALVGWAAFGSIAAGTTAKGYMDMKTQQQTGPATYVGNLPDYAYDAAGQVDRNTGDKSLGATGDLVFGLNSRRHG
jgi:hypothetical protein